MTRASASIAQRWVEAWNTRNADQVLACLTPDAVYEDVALGAVNRSHEETRQFVSGAWIAFPDLRFELTGSAITGDSGTIEWTMLGTHRGDFPGLPATGKAFSVRGVSVVELAGGQIRRVRDYWDFATVLRQLGVLPEPSA